MTIKFKRTMPHLYDGNQATGKSLRSAQTGRAVAEAVNYLRNWRYSQPIVNCAGLTPPPSGASNYGNIYPILRNITKRDTANPERYFGVVADPVPYFDGADEVQELIWFGDSVTGNRIHYRDYGSSSDFEQDFTTPPFPGSTIIATSGIKSGVSTPFEITPASEFQMIHLAYFNMGFRGLGVFEIPNPNLTGTQAGCTFEEVQKDAVVRGDYTSPDDTFGSALGLLGNSASADTADTIERATRRSWQWCHPFGVWLGLGATGFTSGVFYNVFGNTSVKFQPRKIFDDNRKVRITVAVVMTADAGAAFRIRNSTHSSYTYTDTLSSSYTTPTLVTYDAATTGLRVARGEQNELVFEMAYLTSGTKNIKIHSIAVYEEDPFDSVA